MTTKVLAVDDSMTIRDILKYTLVEAGFSVELANDGEHGLEMLRKNRPDVIITDINMPRLDGLGFIEKVRRDEACRSIPILVLTTESAPELKARARSAGATGWIVKPSTKPSLYPRFSAYRPRGFRNERARSGQGHLFLGMRRIAGGDAGRPSGDRRPCG